MLRYYYDINEKENFRELFKGLWVADHPTQWQGKFQVLHLDFSQVGGNADALPLNFNRYFGVRLDDFAERYAAYYPADFVERIRGAQDANTKFALIIAAASARNHKLYLIVDEYDNFTNTILNEEGEAIYHAITLASGFYRDVFKKFKGNFDRILMLGVSPVALDDVTSGYNIATSITMDARFNRMLGFSETDVREMIRYYQSAGTLKADEEHLIAEMKPWYDGYCFSEEVVYTDPKMFNCDMVTYYLNYYIQHGCAPKEMVDRNTCTDYTKLDKLIKLDQLDGDRKGVLLEVAEKGTTTGIVANSFPASRLTDPEIFKSLLFYYGMLTITGTYGIEQELGIPNNNVRKQYYDFLLNEYKKVHPINLSFMNAYLSLNPYYLTAPEVELNHGYCDFFLMPDLIRWPMVKHSYILELKYLSATATDERAEAQRTEAIKQVKDYASGPKVQTLIQGTTLHLIVAQIKGYDLEAVLNLSCDDLG